MVIAIDFDGTCVTHDYPHVGHDIGAQPVLRALVAAGHQLVLWTMRSETSAGPLQHAVDWFAKNEIPLYGIQRNPTQDNWTQSPKAYAQLYIDDAALGCPLSHSAHGHPFVNWDGVKDQLLQRNVIFPHHLP